MAVFIIWSPGRRALTRKAVIKHVWVTKTGNYSTRKLRTIVQRRMKHLKRRCKRLSSRANTKKRSKLFKQSQLSKRIALWYICGQVVTEDGGGRGGGGASQANRGRFLGRLSTFLCGNSTFLRVSKIMAMELAFSRCTLLCINGLLL